MLVSADEYRANVKEGFIKEALLGSALRFAGQRALPLIGAVGKQTRRDPLGSALLGAFVGLTAKDVLEGKTSVGEGMGMFALPFALKRGLRRLKPGWSAERAQRYGIPKIKREKIKLTPFVEGKSKYLPGIDPGAMKKTWSRKNLRDATKGWGLGAGALGLELAAFGGGGEIGKRVLPVHIGKNKPAKSPHYLPPNVYSTEYRPRNLPM